MKLGDLITPAKVERCGNREFPVLSMTMHDGIVLQADRFKKAIASKDQSTYKVVKPGQLVVGFPIDEGVIYIQGYEYEGIMSPAYIVWNVDTKLVDTRYLELALHSPQSMSFYKEKMRGTTARRRSLPAATLVELNIPVPNRKKQNEIVDTLSGIRNSIAESEVFCRRLDELVKSRFVEMFGDPDTNPKAFEVKAGSKLFKIGNGKAKPNSERFEEGVPAYGGNGISWYTNEALVDHATIVIGRVGRNCGNTRLVEEPCWVTDNAMFIKDFKDASFDLIFLSWLMEIIGFNRFADKGDLWKITQRPFMEYDFYIPPLALQREFAAFVQQVDKLKLIAQQQIEKLQMLYDSLAQEYFSI